MTLFQCSNSKFLLGRNILLCLLTVGTVCLPVADKPEPASSDSDNDDMMPDSARLEKRFVLLGRMAESGEVPYIVSLLHYQHENYFFFCTGAIISSTYVLTSARCMMETDLDSIRIYPNKRNQKFPEDEMENLYTVDEIKVHHRYQNNSNTDDIALIKLSSPIEFSKNIKPARLPNKPVGIVTAYHSGWSMTQFPGDPQYLELIEIETHPHDHCKQYHGKKFNIGNLCAGGGLSGYSCRNDQGEPLTIYENDKHIIIGLRTSYEEFQCGDINIYTNVHYYRRWIQHHAV